MAFPRKSIFLFGLLASCGGEWVSGDRAVSCDISEVLFGTASRIATAPDAGTLYVLDRFGNVYAYGKNRARVCAFEPDRSLESDAKMPVSMAKDIDFAGSSLYYSDGVSILRAGDGDFSCDVSPNAFAATPSHIYYAPSAGIQKVKIGSSGCTKTGTSFPAARVVAMDAEAETVVTAETSGAISDPPERISAYDANGNILFRSALSGDFSNSHFFCEASRIRIGATFIALLDAECGILGIFDLSGGLLHRLELSEWGIRNPVDMDLSGDDLYLLTTSSAEPLRFLDFAAFAFGEE